MTDLQQNAIDKIDSQAEKENSGMAKKIAQWIIENRINNDINAGNIAAPESNRSLKACCDEIMKKAKNISAAEADILNLKRCSDGLMIITAL